MKKTYKSKIAVWLPCVVLACTIIPIIPMLSLRSFGMAEIFSIALIGATDFFVIHLLFNTCYTIEGDELTVSCGFIRDMRFDIGQIERITSTHTILSSPAASMDRIAVHFRNKQTPLVISPKEKEKFIADLQRINPAIRYVDGEKSIK